MLKKQVLPNFINLETAIKTYDRNALVCGSPAWRYVYHAIHSADNPVKGEPFECGIPTRGSSWLPSHIGYYLFAILFLMFDIETVLLYPWAVVVKQFGPMALVSIGFFLLVLVFGLAYAWRKGALEWK